MNHRIIATAAAALLLLTGCAGTESTGETTETPAGTNAPAATDEATEEEPAQETPEAAAGLTFGDTNTWADGLAVTVSKPKTFKPSEYAFVDDAEEYLKFTVTVVNGSEENVDLALFYVTMQSGNEEAEEVFDSDNKLEGSPSTTLLPGRESKFAIGFGVADPDDLVMEVTPGAFDYEAAIFTS